MALREKTRPTKEGVTEKQNLPFLGGIEIRVDKNGKQEIIDIPDVFKSKNPVRGNVKRCA